MSDDMTDQWEPLYRAEKARADAAEAAVERLRAGLTVVMGEHARQKWHPDTVYPTEASRNWHDGYISCAAHLAIEVRKYVDPEGAAEDAETWRIGNSGTDTEWWERTGHCGHCGLVASSCDCDGGCGCWDKHGPPLEPWVSLPARADAAEAAVARVRALHDADGLCQCDSSQCCAACDDDWPCRTLRALEAP